jgi:hypothetical protein
VRSRSDDEVLGDALQQLQRSGRGALGRFAGGGRRGADSFRYAATNPINIIRGFFGRGPSADIHFASEARLQREIGRFDGYIAQGTDRGFRRAAFVLHSIQDVHGAHQGYTLPFGHARDGTKPDRIIGDARFLRAANESFQLLSGNRNATLSAGQINDLISAIVNGCGRMADNLHITRPAPTGGGGGGGYPSWYYSMWAFANWVSSIRIERVTVTITSVDVEIIEE